jgi:DNA-binding NtrC family response regulator
MLEPLRQTTSDVPTSAVRMDRPPGTATAPINARAGSCAGSPGLSPIPAMPAKRQIDLIGRSPVIAALQQEIERVARSDAKVLITGESGVGKDIVARAIHARGPRATNVFAPVNCAGLPETLLESELFGHVKGSFTGAYRDKKGLLETAHLGTVFLDEVGEMTPRMQGVLLRFLETGELQKVGAEGISRTVNVRVIAATNRDLVDRVKQGAFREDLFYRLNVIHIVVPSLRDRPEDIPLLLNHFLGPLAARHRSSITSVAADAVKALTKYAWPGNVRELENVIERLVVTVQGTTIESDHLAPEIRAQDIAPRPMRERRRTVADDLCTRMFGHQESFWTTVYPSFMDREITRANVREIVQRGLEEARGQYKIVVRLFNMAPQDYKRFLNFLQKHDCNVPFQDYR